MSYSEIQKNKSIIFDFMDNKLSQCSSLPSVLSHLITEYVGIGHASVEMPLDCKAIIKQYAPIVASRPLILQAPTGHSGRLLRSHLKRKSPVSDTHDQQSTANKFRKCQ